MKKLKVSLFSLVSIILILWGLEKASYFLLLKYFRMADSVRLNINPIIEYEDGLPRFRRNSYTHKGNFFILGHETIKDNLRYKRVVSKISFDQGGESLIRSAVGDMLINKHGFRGPYFKKEKPKNVYRVLALGGSTTAGNDSNENNWPMILERMLNNKLNKDIHYQVINGGLWGNNVCHVRYLYEREVDNIKPDMVLVMTGWNDIDKINNKNILSEEDYCPKDNILKRLNTYRLLSNWLSSTNQKNKPPDFNIYDQNIKFHKNNLRQIIKDAENKKILVGLVSLPSVMETNTPIEKLKNYPQLVNMKDGRIHYEREVGGKINFLKKTLAEEHTNAFYINSGVSFSTTYKKLFFLDAIHLTGEGYRLLAYGIYKGINKKLNIHNDVDLPNSEKTINKQQLEIYHIKSILTAFKLEDFSYAGCVSIFKECTFKKISLPNLEYATSLVSFSLGSLLKFSQEIKASNVHNNLELFLNEAIKIAPLYSVSYWTLAELYSIVGKKDLENKFKSKAYKLNPLLKNISFKKLQKFYKKRHKDNSLFLGLNDLILILGRLPNYIAPYQYFAELNILDQAPSQDDKSIKGHGELIRSIYYTSPLLGRSLFNYAYNYFISVKDLKTAAHLKNLFNYIKPQYAYE
jgi:lysophospholipase L1-like esterase